MAIAGGGPVGLSLAAASTGFDVVLLEPNAATHGGGQKAGDDFDVRVYALSPGSRSFLEEIGAWHLLAPDRIATVRSMAVCGDEGASLSFAPPSGEALAWIVEASRLTAALEACVQSRPWVSVRRMAARAFGSDAAGSWVELADGERLSADLLVGADGPDSKVRAAAGIEAKERDYGEIALVANFECEKAHGEIARQWFRGDGVLAWLPLPGRRISIVWSAPRVVAEEALELDSRAFERRVRDAGGSVLGDLRLISGIGRFPLRLIRVANPVAPGIALVGDAAHAVHPLAGQGVNLGFQDARVLAKVLAERSALERPGDLRVLRRYARQRRETVAAMQLVTDALDQLFAARTPGVAALRNFGLRVVDSQRWIKRVLADQAMR